MEYAEPAIAGHVFCSGTDDRWRQDVGVRIDNDHMGILLANGHPCQVWTGAYWESIIHAMKTLLIRNPVAGQRDIEDDLKRVVQFLGKHGWDVSVRVTERHGHATLLARQAAEQGIAEEEALAKGMEEKSKEFAEAGAEVYVRA